MFDALLITGAAGGIGHAIAFAAAPSAQALFLIDIDTDRLCALRHDLLKHHPNLFVATFSGSVVDETFIDELFISIKATTHTLSAAIHAASILRGSSGLVSGLELTVPEWQSIIDINLTGSFIVSRAVLRHFIANKCSGDLLLFGSENASNPFPYDAPYAASKAGVVALAESLNEEVMRYGIRVQSLSPSAVDTPLWDQNNSVLPRPSTMLSPSYVADIALSLLTLPRDGYVRNLQIFPTKTRKRKR